MFVRLCTTSKEQQEGESKQQFPKSLFIFKNLFIFFQRGGCFPFHPPAIF